MNWLFKSAYGRFLLHLFFWTGAILFPIAIRPLFFKEGTAPLFFAPSGDEWRIMLVFFSFIIGFFYLNTGWLVPRLFLKRRIFAYILAVLAGWIVSVYLTKTIASSGWVVDPALMKDRRLFGISAGFLLFCLGGLGYRLAIAWFQSEQIRAVLENEKLKTELSFLQNQINPHFLFNTLNTIYTFALQKSDKTAGAVLQLSNLLRAILDTRPEQIPLEDEIRQLQEYIALQQLRLNNKTRLRFDLHGDPDGKTIAPLLLLPFVENAFKYGVSTHIDSEIVLDLSIRAGELRFISNNRLFPGTRQEASTGIGIQNVRRRLDLLYPNRHDLQIRQTAETYTILLTIRFYE